MANNKSFSKIITSWYQQYKRDLPWRQTTDAYAIWISEIILQQTRVDQGLDYYLRFMDTFPDVESLARASEETVLKLWQGLGYYSRARNLHRAARLILSQFDGEFPEKHEDILQLPGVGTYTAAAIASFAFNLPHSVIDGNVIRLISRYFGITEDVGSGAGLRLIREKTEFVFDPKHPHLHNQAIMEFGAMQCVPRNPDCEICPLKTGCRAYEAGQVNMLPVKKGKAKVRHRYFHYLVLSGPESVIMKKRTDNDVWKHLFEFPHVETGSKKARPNFNGLAKAMGLQLSDLEFRFAGNWDQQVLSHQKINARFWFYEIPDHRPVIPKDWKLVDRNDLNDLPVPKLIERHIHEC